MELRINPVSGCIVKSKLITVVIPVVPHVHKEIIGLYPSYVIFPFDNQRSVQFERVKLIGFNTVGGIGITCFNVKQITWSSIIIGPYGQFEKIVYTGFPFGGIKKEFYGHQGIADV
jgi:hypothetical protein